MRHSTSQIIAIHLLFCISCFFILSAIPLIYLIFSNPIVHWDLHPKLLQNISTNPLDVIPSNNQALTLDGIVFEPLMDVETVELNMLETSNTDNFIFTIRFMSLQIVQFVISLFNVQLFFTTNLDFRIITWIMVPHSYVVKAGQLKMSCINWITSQTARSYKAIASLFPITLLSSQ